MEVHMKYNLRRKKTNEKSPKKVVEMKKVAKTKRTSENPPKKVPERNNVEPHRQKTPKILQRENQIEISSTKQPSAPSHRTHMDKPKV
jgi:hypothetical protein